MKNLFFAMTCVLIACAIPQSVLGKTEPGNTGIKETLNTQSPLQFVKANVGKYYSNQDVIYFYNILKVYDSFTPVFKSIIEKQLATNTNKVSNPKEKLTIMLLTIEVLLDKDEFLQRQGFDEYDDIVIDAHSIAYHINKESVVLAKELERKLREQDQILREKDKQLDIALQGYEGMFRGIDKGTVNKDPELQKSLKWYLQTIKGLQTRMKDRQIPVHMKRLTQGL